MGGYYRNFGIAPISPPNLTSVLCLKILEHTAVLSPIDGSLTKRNKNQLPAVRRLPTDGEKWRQGCGTPGCKSTEKIPLFSEVLDLVVDFPSAKFFVEIKHNEPKEQSRKLQELVWNILSERGLR